MGYSINLILYIRIALRIGELPDGRQFYLAGAIQSVRLRLILKRGILKTGKIPVGNGQHHTTTEGNDFGQ